MEREYEAGGIVERCIREAFATMSKGPTRSRYEILVPLWALMLYTEDEIRAEAKMYGATIVFYESTIPAELRGPLPQTKPKYPMPREFA